MDYLSCSYCGSNLIGKTEKRVQMGRVGRILGLELIHVWICLRCCQIEDEIISIREVFETYVKPKT